MWKSFDLYVCCLGGCIHGGMIPEKVSCGGVATFLKKNCRDLVGFDDIVKG